MKKSRTRLTLVFLVFVMAFCFATSVQADTTDYNNGSQGLIFSSTTLPPAPIRDPLEDLKLEVLLLLPMWF